MTIGAFDLGYHYGQTRAVRGVSFEIASGEVFGLLGPNGAGKTTILRMLAGVIRPTEGHAEILGIDVAKAPARAKRELGFLSGDTALYARLSALETLEYFARLYGLDDATRARRLDATIHEFGLESLLELRTGALSSGQRQRLNLARAFLTDPAVLILDEPTVALDVVSGQFVEKAIDRARLAGKAVLFSTHVMSEVEALCDRIALLVGGCIADVGTPAELIERHQVSSLRALIVSLHEEQNRGV
jgi:sodium transport system ATP-binding protein